MKIYQVGGAVRDRLLGLPVQDIDYLVVGSTPEQMVAAGFQPVGRDFPVFLHPVTHAEYALARTERKTAAGYHGFVFHCAPDVTIEQDLLRRDLTINAMAVEDHAGQADLQVIDPYNGQQDLQQKIFRHVSSAFQEDPVRILRVARFAARFTDFSVAPDTLHLMRTMVTQGEVDALVPERIWQELARGLMEQQPSRMFQVLHKCGALARILPELDWHSDTAQAGSSPQHLAAADFAARHEYPISVRWATLLGACRTLDAEHAEALCDRIKAPRELRDLAVITCREQSHTEKIALGGAEPIVQLLERCDAFRRRERFTELILTLCCIHLAAPPEYQPARFLNLAHAAALSVPTGEIAARAHIQHPGQPAQIAAMITAARVDAVRNVLDQFCM